MSQLETHLVDRAVTSDEAAVRPLEELPDATPLAELAARIRGNLQRQHVTLQITGRPGMAVRYDPNVKRSADAFKAWMKAATVEKDGVVDSFDEVKFNCLVVAATAAALIVEGHEIPLEGEPAFRNPAVQESMARKTAAETVRAWFGGDEFENDFEISAHADEILERAGLRSRAKEAAATADPS